MIVGKASRRGLLDGSERNCTEEVDQLFTNLGWVFSRLLSVPTELLITGRTVLYTSVHETQYKYE